MGLFLREHPLVAGGVFLGALAVAGTLRDSRLEPTRWQPPDPPELVGPLAPNTELAGLETVVSCEHPEDVAFDEVGRLYTGSEDGIIYRTVEPVDDGTDLGLEPIADTGGRPLALECAGEDLLVCVRDVGLVAVDRTGTTRVLAGRAGGREIAFADDLHVTDDGSVYFSDASVHGRYREELLELQDTGRLLAYHPGRDETTVELGDLGFANGVAPGPEGESVLVTETSRYRVTRYWFEGNRAGESERVLTNLPGLPDNIEAAGDGSYWLAVPNRRDRVLDWLHKHPAVVRQIGKLPPAALNALDIEPYGLVLRVDADGTILGSLHDPEGGVYGVTSATPHDGALYLGTLFGERVVRYPLP